jgi:hypothetical protein
MADPVVQPDACTTLTATSALDVWSEHLAKNSNNFFCGNPDCIQLYDRKKTKTAGSESITFEKKEDVCTIEVSVNGKMEERYRFSEDDQIFAASRGSVCPETGTPVVETTHVVCGKCMRAGAHVGIDGVCRAAAAEAVADVDPSTLPRADTSGVRITSPETLNANSYTEISKLDHLREEAAQEIRGAERDGGAAQRKAILAERRAKVEAKRAEVTKSVEDKTTAKKELKEAQELLGHLEQGFDPDTKPEEEPEMVDGEDLDEAIAFYALHENNVGKLRGEYPKSALALFGEPPSEERVQTQRNAVRELEKTVKDARNAFALVKKDFEDAEKQVRQEVMDYDDNQAEAVADKRAKPNAGGKKRKKREDMTPGELAADDVRRANEAEKNRKKRAEVKEKCDGYDAMKKEYVKYKKCQQSLTDEQERNSVLNERYEKNKRRFADFFETQSERVKVEWSAFKKQRRSKEAEERVAAEKAAAEEARKAAEEEEGAGSEPEEGEEDNEEDDDNDEVNNAGEEMDAEA